MSAGRMQQAESSLMSRRQPMSDNTCAWTRAAGLPAVLRRQPSLSHNREAIISEFTLSSAKA